MPKFVPVKDVEKPLCEQEADDDGEYDKHRKFDAPHMLQKSKDKVDRGWKQGNVGWGVLGSHGSSGKDSGAQVAKKATGAHKMVKNEKGLWVKVKDTSHIDNFSSKGVGRGGGIPVIAGLAEYESSKYNSDSDENEKQFEDDHKKHDDNDEDSNKKTKHRRRSESREKDRHRKRDRSDSYERKERKRKDLRRESRPRDYSNDRYEYNKRHRDDRRDDFFRDKRKDKGRDRRRSRSKDREKDKKKERSSRKERFLSRSRSRSYSKDRRKKHRSGSNDRKSEKRRDSKEGFKEGDKKSHVREGREKEDEMMNDLLEMEKNELGDKKIEKNNENSVLEDDKNHNNNEDGEIIEKETENENKTEKETEIEFGHENEDEIEVENEDENDFELTAVQVVNRFLEIYSQKSLFLEDRLNQIVELFTDDATITSLKTGAKYIDGLEAIKKSFDKTVASETKISKRIFIQVKQPKNKYLSSQTSISFCLDFHRSGTAPGLGDKTKDNVLLYRCETNSTNENNNDELSGENDGLEEPPISIPKITNVWGMVDSEKFASREELTLSEVLGYNKVWKNVEAILKKDFPSLDLKKHVHFHNYDKMEVWG